MKISSVLLFVNVLLIIFIWTFTIVSYTALPEIIPTHFAVNGTVDGEDHKKTIWFLPAIATFVFLGLVSIPKDPNSPFLNVPESYRNNEKLKILMYSILLPVLLLFGDIIVESVMIAQGKMQTMSNAIFIFLALLFIVIGVNIFKMLKESRVEISKK